MQYLKTAILQTDLVWLNKVKNKLQFLKKIDQIEEKVDLIILPEMFTTGFCMCPQEVAESMQGSSVKWMQKIAIEKNTAIAGSVIIVENNNYYNRFLFVHPSGKIDYYNKKHLFTLAGEDKIYTAGNEKIIINYKGWKICPLVCYDLRFPVWSRNVEHYDILIYVANWPKPRISAWDTLLKARSIENMCYTIGVNRVGKDANKLEYSGHSAIYDSLGEKLVETAANEEDIAIGNLDKNHLNVIRNKLNFLSDQDKFEIEQ